MAGRGRQPRWPDGTPVAPSGKGPGGGRFRDDGKPNKPHSDTWDAKVAKRVGAAAGGGVKPRSGTFIGNDPSSHSNARPVDAKKAAPRKAAPAKAAPVKKAAPAKKAAAARPMTPQQVINAKKMYGDWEADTANLGGMGVPNLRRLAEHYGLPKSGTGAQLQARIKRHIVKTRSLSQAKNEDDEAYKRRVAGMTTLEGFRAAEDQGQTKDWAQRASDQMVGGGGERSAEDVSDFIVGLRGMDDDQIQEALNQEFEGVPVQQLQQWRRDLSAGRRLFDRAAVRVLDRAIKDRGGRSDMVRAEASVDALVESIRRTRTQGGGSLQERALAWLDESGFSRAQLLDMLDVLSTRNRGDDDSKATVMDADLAEAIYRALRVF